MEAGLIGAAVGCLLTFFICRGYARRRERALLERLEDMLQQARSGVFHPESIDESMVSSIENSMRVFLQEGIVRAENLQEQKAGIETLISDISHQTITPLSNISIYSQLLEEELQGTDCGAQAQAIRHQAEKLNFLIDSLVKTSRLENGIIRTQPQSCNLGALAEDIVCQCREKAAKKDIRIRLAHSEEPVLVFCDPKWTKEACFNILDNAVKYGGDMQSRTEISEDTSISIEESAPVTAIELTVRSYPMFGRLDIADHGIGISEEEIPKIFGRFYRSAEVGELPGVGLGLYLAREIIQSQGGYIKVSSKMGQGTVFSVFLPLFQ